MPTIYIDADACPVKPETYRVAVRHALPVVVVANNTMMIPDHPLISMVAVTGFGAADDWIAAHIGANDVCVTADVPLAARCVARGAVVVDPKGRLLTEATIGEAVGMRDLMDELRQAGATTGGPAPMTAKDRSRFLSTLDQVVNAALRAAR